MCGPTGTGKTRTAVEVVRQAVAAGGRVLVLTGDAVRADALLDRLDGFVGIDAVRCVGRDERADRLSPVAASRTPAARDAGLLDAIRAKSRHALAAAERDAARLAVLDADWPRWHALAADSAALDGLRRRSRPSAARICRPS